MPSDGLAFDEIGVALGGERHRVLIVCPTAAIVAGKEKLEALRAETKLSELDESILAEVRRRAPLQGFIFRGRNDEGSGHWTLDPDLSDNEKGELCELMFRSHMPLKRELVRVGAIDNIYIDWGAEEIQAFTAGIRRLREGLRERLRELTPGTPEARAARLDLWIVDRVNFYLGADLNDVLEQILPGRLRTRPNRLAQVRNLLGQSPG